MPQRIAVIGAGVLGLAAAQSLFRQGAKVTVFDKSAPGNGTSQISYAWVNANGKAPDSYHELNARARCTSAGRPATPHRLSGCWKPVRWSERPTNLPCAS